MRMAQDSQSRLTVQRNTESNVSEQQTAAYPITTDALAISASAEFEELSYLVIRDVQAYLDVCGGSMNQTNRGMCWAFMKLEHGDRLKASGERPPSMVPDNGAVWREFVRSSV